MLPLELSLKLTMCVVAGAHQQQPAVHQLLSRPSTECLLMACCCCRCTAWICSSNTSWFPQAHYMMSLTGVRTQQLFLVAFVNLISRLTCVNAG